MCVLGRDTRITIRTYSVVHICNRCIPVVNTHPHTHAHTHAPTHTHTHTYTYIHPPVHTQRVHCITSRSRLSSNQITLSATSPDTKPCAVFTVLRCSTMCVSTHVDACMYTCRYSMDIKRVSLYRCYISYTSAGCNEECLFAVYL